MLKSIGEDELFDYLIASLFERLSKEGVVDPKRRKPVKRCPRRGIRVNGFDKEGIISFLGPTEFIVHNNS